MKVAALLKSKVARGLAIFVLLFAGLWIFLSLTWANRTLKFVLKIDEIPSSVTVLEMREDAWTDEVISGRFKIHPDDFPAIIRGRAYSLTTKSPIWSNWIEGRAMTHWYDFSVPGLRIRLQTDEKKEFVDFVYAAD